jgi:hypothetical protein
MEILTIYHKFLRNSVPIAAVILLLQYNHMTTTFSKENLVANILCGTTPANAYNTVIQKWQICSEAYCKVSIFDS